VPLKRGDSDNSGDKKLKEDELALPFSELEEN
jgi:hypothetical protein